MKTPVRLIGIGVTQLQREKYVQTSLFSEEDEIDSVTRAVDNLKKKYGEKIIKKGVNLKRGA